ncbi:hypothetical protein [Rhodovulum strictum]|uniref:Uncharacterized protein n=3 Tax=Rhodovulum TaxID=34008 RepID=A0A844BPN5_9RHOB|nr:hypothetical protein [Rhodovulum strictum]MRH22942.1 hypothetical protein [Rhodovulum strictum]
MELETAGRPASRGRLMARVTHIHTIDEVARRIDENLELIEVVSGNSDNIDYGEMIWVDNGTEEGIKAFTDRGIECLRELLADIRTWDGGIREFLRDEQCDPDVIERIMADEKNH